jgi:hypothetical protein
MRVRELIAHGQYELLPFAQCVWDEWDTGRDGYVYRPDATKKELSK